jgi:hypothetical protein
MTTSSIHQPVKKDGAGGHSWGTATDVTDFAPVGAGGAKVVIGAPVATSASNRPGTAGIYDATHPRNQFARKPRTTGATAPAAEGEEQAAIDWTSPGTTAASTQIIQAAANPAHLGLYQQPATGPSVSVLRAIPTTVKDIPGRTNPAQMVTKYPPMAQVAKQQMPRMLQPRGR